MAPHAVAATQEKTKFNPAATKQTPDMQAQTPNKDRIMHCTTLPHHKTNNLVSNFICFMFVVGKLICVAIVQAQAQAIHSAQTISCKAFLIESTPAALEAAKRLIKHSYSEWAVVDCRTVDLRTP